MHVSRLKKGGEGEGSGVKRQDSRRIGTVISWESSKAGKLYLYSW